MDAINRYLGEEYIAAQGALDAEAAKLKNAQVQAQAAYWNYVNAEQEISAGDRAELARLAALACDTTLSVAERESASQEYDALFRRILSAQGTAQTLTELAQAAWGAGTWNSVAHDRALVTHTAGLFNGKWVYYNQPAEPHTRWAAELILNTALEAAERQNALEMETERARLQLIAEDFRRQRGAWEAQAAQLQLSAQREWTKAAGRINEDYNRWRRDYAEEYRAKTTAWEANYLQFVLDKQEWVEAQYLYAANVGNAPLLAQAQADAGAVITRAMAGTMAASMNRETLDTGVYVEELLTGTALTTLMAQAGELSGRAAYGAQAVKAGNTRQTVTASLAAAQKTQQMLNEDLQTNAARLAALQARKLLEEARASYLERLEAENKGMWEWQQQLVKRDGYQVEGNSISRYEVVDATLLGGLDKKKQTVRAYEDFITAAPKTSVKLDENVLSGLDPLTIMDLVNHGYREYAAWGTNIFGKVEGEEIVFSKVTINDYFERKDLKKETAEAREEIEGRTERDGELGKHIGYAPILKSDDINFSKDKYANIKYAGSGQMGNILLDFQWNAAEANKGWSEAAKPFYDQKMWSDNPYFKPPTIRDAVDIAMSVAATVVGVAGTVLGGWGPVVAFAINQVDDLLFAVADTAFTNEKYVFEKAR